MSRHTATHQRAQTRKAANNSAVLHHRGKQIPVVLKNVSRDGAAVVLKVGSANLALDGPIFLEVPGFARLPFRVRWTDDTSLGGAFDIPLSRKAGFNAQLDRLLMRIGR
ncbi:PilZ domain-containing protein [Aliishimia ponticola]|uniref:PilZ domain-containing protein n=1 Tax=Aliishimia ponticola TaxID=2499833 RepID=A0A4S4NFP9_9RHOB|nr:PilZ domain-containing protein [Aliishimia ponticola]THH36951.1 PilZ domain-containing protein [Aliishimia ponticola]